MVGNYYDSVKFDNDTLVSNGFKNHFFSTYDFSGNFQSVRDIKGTHNISKVITLSHSEDYGTSIGGFFADSLFIANDTLISKGQEDIFIAKYNLIGELDWIRQAGSTGPDRCNTIFNDEFGNLYLTGYITGSALFDSTGFKNFDSSPIVSKGGYDILVAKYNRDGRLQWKSRNGDTGNDIGYGLDIYRDLVSFSGEIIYNQDTLRSSSISDNDTGC
ncbi:hypothetical protein ES705_51190 [subsurface metagenome]